MNAIQLTFIIAGFAMNIILIIGAAVWAVGSIKSSTQVLAADIRALSKVVDHLAVVVDKINSRLDSTIERVVRLEAKEHGSVK